MIDNLQNILKSYLDNSSSFVFLGGVHGVGKTTACNTVFVEAGYCCVTASSLIKTFKSNTDKGKRVNDIAYNQAALLKQLAIERQKHDQLLLDGHFCLINSRDQIEPIAVDVFNAINPDLLILLKGDPEVIAERLTRRDGKPWSLTFIQQFQEAEERHAQLISRKLNTPLKVIAN